jgi:plastocyanin
MRIWMAAIMLSSSIGVAASFNRAGTGGALSVNTAAALTGAGTGLKCEACPLAYPDPTPKVVQITIDRATFGDTPAGIKVGDIVEWENRDIFDHTTTAKAGAWDVVIPAGKKARVTMKKAGAFDYFCKFHPNMTGTVTVKK